jgi:hypothetical protein
MTASPSPEHPAGDAAGSGAWTCPRCGRENKATWNQCPACESDREGLASPSREPVRKGRRTNPITMIAGLLILVGLVVLAFYAAGPLGDWIGEQWDAFFG